MIGERVRIFVAVAFAVFVTAALAEAIPVWRTPGGSLHLGDDPPPGSVSIPSAEPDSAAATPNDATTALARKQLYAVSSDCVGGRGALRVRGDVRNSSPEALDHVVAVVSFRAADGRVLGRATAPIDEDPIPGGGTSSFEVRSAEIPAVARCEIGFTSTAANGAPAAPGRSALPGDLTWRR